MFSLIEGQIREQVLLLESVKVFRKTCMKSGFRSQPGPVLYFICAHTTSMLQLPFTSITPSSAKCRAFECFVAPFKGGRRGVAI